MNENEKTTAGGMLVAKALILFYSLGGNCRRLANTEERLTGAEVYELTTKTPRSKLGALFGGCFSAVKYKKDKKLRQIDVDFDRYDDFVLILPLWAGCPAPAFNNVMEKMPKFKKIKVVICSKSGNSDKAKEKIENIITKKKCTMIDYVDKKAKKKEKKNA